MQNFGDHRQGAHRPRPDSGHKQQLGEIGRTAIGGGRQIAMQTPRNDIARAHVVLCSATIWMGKRIASPDLFPDS